MTDKQIIIDGKTIGCPCYINRPLHRYDKACLVQSQAFTEQQTEEKPILRCDEIKNCPIKENYKQLKRKEQEYEELRQYHNKCCEENVKKLEEWLEKYNQFSKDFFIGKYCKKEYCELLKAKEQECEKLKKQACGLRPELKYIIDKTCSKYNINAKYYHEKIVEIINNLDKYKQTLAEIKEVAENSCCLQPTSDCEEYKNCKECSKKSDDETVKQIIKKISEVKYAR